MALCILLCYILNFTYWASVATRRQQMVKHRIIFMIISRQYKYLGAEWVREFEKTVTRTKKNGFLACLLLTVLLLHAGCVCCDFLQRPLPSPKRRCGTRDGSDQSLIITAGNVNINLQRRQKIIENKNSQFNPFLGYYTWNHPYVRHRTHKTNGSFLYGSPGLENKTEICFM